MPLPSPHINVDAKPQLRYLSYQALPLTRPHSPSPLLAPFLTLRQSDDAPAMASSRVELATIVVSLLHPN